MHISIQLAPEAASLLHRHFAKRGAARQRSGSSERRSGNGGSTTAAGGGLSADLAKLASVIRPVHEGIEDESLKTFFMAEVADADAAARLIEQLRRSPHVLAVYAKPADELP